ncbi:RagB/SusD domain protein [Petrimonas sp. IBARAKI]|nr:RagB/SusD domain protein [Petrimonas sp. IBARAKI]
MKKILLLCVIAIAFTNCDDLLKENPQALAVETFYNTTGEVEAGVAAIFEPLRSAHTAEYISLNETCSDFMAGRASWENAGKHSEILNTQNSTRAQNGWTNFYSAIRNANLIIKNVPNGVILSEADKSRYVGEAKFLRALSYFHLVRSWGAVPLRTEENSSENNLARSSVEEVYALIVSDLLAAENDLPDMAPVAGRVSKWAAKTLLADVYFYLGQYDKATSKSEEVIQSGKYSLVEVSEPEDFENLFGASVVNTSEEIFYLKYNKERNWNYLLYLHGVGVPYIGVAGYYAITSNVSYTQHKNWDVNDLRNQFGWYPYSGYDPGTILCKKFNDYGSKTPSNDYPLYRYADLLLIHAEASCRANNNPTPAGLESLNKIHRRAYGYPSNEQSPVDFKISDYNMNSFVELCIQERGYETVGEGKRWFDVRRLGKDKAREILQKMRGVTIHDGKFLFPIPQNEYQYNEAITDQNPGY